MFFRLQGSGNNCKRNIFGWWGGVMRNSAAFPAEAGLRSVYLPV
jgi:hypothetical protein